MGAKDIPDYPFIPIDQRKHLYCEMVTQIILKKWSKPYMYLGFIADHLLFRALGALKQMGSGYIVRICTSPLTKNHDSVKEKT